MKTLTSLCLLLILVLPATHAADDPPVSGIPPELEGFKGMVTGELVKKKGADQLDVKISGIKRTWKGNEAEQPEKAVGKTLTVDLSEVSDHHGERIRKEFAALKVGDAIEVELFDLGKKTLIVKEWLKKVES